MTPVAFAHSPGPWLVAKGEVYGQFSIYAAMGTPVHAVAVCPHESVIAESAGNALLIAAAPDLLAAVKALCSMSLMPVNSDQQSRFDRAAVLAEEAIAKAEGRS